MFISFCVLLSACEKSADIVTGCTTSPSTVVVPASEIDSLRAWVVAHRPAAILHPGGFYYEVNATGSGVDTPNICSVITVKYAGYLTNGSRFTSSSEETVPATFALSGLIVGWQRGLPLIRERGSINLYLPPSLGYGANGSGAIPANSILLFTVQLTVLQ
jgi:FKBP-type peptidyl-prolyl cis-trans isomerase FkpA